MNIANIVLIDPNGQTDLNNLIFNYINPLVHLDIKIIFAIPHIILWNNSEWYKKLYNTLSPEEAAKKKDGNCYLCDMGSNYDDEDK